MNLSMLIPVSAEILGRINLRVVSRFICGWLALLYCHVMLAQHAGGRAERIAYSRAIVSQYRATFDMPPRKIPSQVAVDAPLLGNGYTGVAIGGNTDKQVYYLARNDFWRLKSGFNESYPAVLGKLQLDVPALKDADYRIDVDLYTAIATSVFKKQNVILEIKSFVSADEDYLVLKLQNKGTGTIKGQIDLLLPEMDQFKNSPPAEQIFPSETEKGKTSKGTKWFSRGFSEQVDIATKAAVAGRYIGNGTDGFVLNADKSLTYVCALSSNFKDKDCTNQVIKAVEGLNRKKLEALETAHKAWWSDYWAESAVQIPDKTIEKQYYLSHYIMGACSRDKQFAPPIFGTWITKEIPFWNGDYHLNYNYMAPYYGLYSSNHLTAAGSYEQPLLDFLQRGSYYSSRITGISDGILYPVGIGPKGIETTRKNDVMAKAHSGFIHGGQVEDEGLFFGQKSNVSYGVTNMATAFYYTYDRAYAQRIYPYVKAAAQFWSQYCHVGADGKYAIANDAIHEGTIGDINPILSLGLARQTLRLAIDISAFLKLDTDLSSVWQQVRANLSEFPVQERNGEKVFRYTEQGTAWWNDNSLGIQHIFPAMQIDLESEKSLITIAHNTITQMKRWTDYNGTNSFFPAAIRVGYPADSILYYLHRYSLHTYANGFQRDNPHGIENCSTVPTTVNHMLCATHQGVLKLFAVWPKTEDASFMNLRTEGAFLVSSKLANGKIIFVDIYSEQGRTCTLDNPWPNRKIALFRNGKLQQRLNGERLMINTQKGQEVRLVPMDNNLIN